MINNVTLLIKTFERPTSLKRLLKSINKYYPNINIIIIDDSKSPLMQSELVNYHANCNYYHIGYDVGLSQGRNFGVDKVKTKYFVLLDDDFFFTKKTNLEELQRVIECNDFDMVGFDFFDYGFCKRNFQGLYEIKGETLISKIGMSRDKINGYKQYDYILNCFIGRTDFFKVNGWDEKIKIGSEHDDFFLNIKQLKPKITHITNVSISHYPKYTKEYKSFRKGRFEKYFFIFLKKNKLKNVIKEGEIYSPKDKVLIKCFSFLGKIMSFFNVNN